MQKLTIDQLAAAVRASDARPVRASDETVNAIVRATLARMTMAALGTGVAIELPMLDGDETVLVVQVGPYSEVQS